MWTVTYQIAHLHLSLSESDRVSRPLSLRSHAVPRRRLRLGSVLSARDSSLSAAPRPCTEYTFASTVCCVSGLSSLVCAVHLVAVCSLCLRRPPLCLRRRPLSLRRWSLSLSLSFSLSLSLSTLSSRRLSLSRLSSLVPRSRLIALVSPLVSPYLCHHALWTPSLSHRLSISCGWEISTRRVLWCPRRC